MKSIYKGISLLALALTLMVQAFGADHEKSKTISEEYNVKATDEFKLVGEDAFIDIMTWDQNKMKVEINIFVRGDQMEDIDVFLDNANPTIERTTTGVEVSLRFCSQINKSGNKTKVKFEGDKWIRIQDYRMEVRVWMPAQNRLDIHTSYSKMTIVDMKGEVRINAYDATVEAKNFSGPTDIDMQYGKGTFGNIEKPDRIKLYETKFTAADLGDGMITTTYSKVHTGDWGKMEVKSYEDKYYTGNIEEMKGSSTYSDFTTKNVKKAVMKMYEGEFVGEALDDFNVDLQYTEFDAQECGNLHIGNGYECHIDLGRVEKLTGKGQYVHMEVDYIGKEYSWDGYEGKHEIGRLGKDVSKVTMTGQYLNAEIGLDPALIYDLDLNLQYPSFEYPHSDFDSRIEKTGDKLKGFLKHKSSSTTRATLTFDSYEGSVELHKIQ
jgi:hypothetical protein